MMNYMFIFIHGILMISFVILPFISKREVVFGIDVPLDANDEPKIKSIKRRFIMMALAVGLGLMIIQLSYNTEVMMLYTILGGIIPYHLVYLVAHYSIKKYKQTQCWPVEVQPMVLDTEFRKKRLTVPTIWYFAYLVIILTGLAMTWCVYENLPAVLNVKFNMNGEAVKMMPKNKALLTLFATQITTTLLLLFVQSIIKKAKQQLSSSDVKASVEANRSFRYVFSVLIYLLGLIINMVFFISLLSTLGLLESSKTVMVFTMILTFIPVVLIFIYAVKYGQDGSKLNQQRTSHSIKRDDDNLWKWGMFYYNPNDPSIFIAKRVGIGWSVNHARWQTWFLYLGLLGFIVFSIMIGR